MRLKDIFDRWGASIDANREKSEFYLDGWEDSEGAIWSTEKVECMISDIRTKFDLRKSDMVLDVGCGSGWIGCALRRSCRSVICMDISEEMVKKAVYFNPVLTTLVANGQHLPFRDGSFDKLLCYFVVMNMENDHDILEMLRESVRVLKKDGIALFGQLPDGAMSPAYEAAKAGYKSQLPASGRPLRSPHAHRFPVRLFDRKNVLDTLRGLGASEYSLLDCFNPFWIQGEPRQVNWRFDILIKK
jgi:SAM-dependent methyltransferase